MNYRERESQSPFSAVTLMAVATATGRKSGGGRGGERLTALCSEFNVSFCHLSSRTSQNKERMTAARDDIKITAARWKKLITAATLNTCLSKIRGQKPLAPFCFRGLCLQCHCIGVHVSHKKIEMLGSLKLQKRVGRGTCTSTINYSRVKKRWREREGIYIETLP